MSIGMLALLAVIPIVAALVLMVGMRWPATRAMPVAWLACVVCGLIGWKLDVMYLLALSLQGVVIAVGVLIIVFGAILILYTLEKSGGMETIQHGMQGKVVAIHGISIAAHSRAYRQRLYTLMREADAMMIACPTAWIDTPRSEQIGPMHNSMTRVDELVPAGITVALGTDNVCDAMVPWNAGDMWHEMTTLATGCRFDYFDELVKIATVNGRKVIGID